MIGSGFDTRGDYATINKDPSAVLPYTLDWTDWLETGDTIVGSIWTLPAGSALAVDSNSFTTTATQAIMSSGTAGTSYTVENHITTANGLQDSRRIVVKVLDR